MTSPFSRAGPRVPKIEPEEFVRRYPPIGNPTGLPPQELPTYRVLPPGMRHDWYEATAGSCGPLFPPNPTYPK